jgi:hypothetical protein
MNERLEPRPYTRRTWLLVAAGAAAVTVVLAGGTLIVRDDGERTSPSAPLRPTHPQIPHQSSAAPQTRDDVLRRALAADQAVRAEVLGGLEAQGPVVCGIHVMGSSADKRTLYLWLSCADFGVVDGVAHEKTGSHEPAVVRVRGSGTDLEVEKVTFPRQQSLATDIKRLFPPSIAAHIYDETNTRTSPSGKEIEAEAVASAG